jgi:NAD(P)-dependent dehydrogenase (short-subunit alcohol dehydrogenase family)
LQSKTVIITGAAGGLGSVLSALAADSGWNAVMLDKNRKGLEQAFDSIDESATGIPVMYPMDLAGVTPEQVGSMLDAVKQEFGGVHALVHCAARFEHLSPLEHFDPAEWLMHMQVNLNAAWLLSALCLPLMRESGGGKIVFLLEDLAKVAGPLWGAYGVSKHALRALAEQLAAECETSGVEVRGINPGPLRSALRSRAYHAENPEEQPDPKVAATEIMRFLEGTSNWPGPIFDLSRQTGD